MGIVSCIPAKDGKEVVEKVLPEAVDNMFLVARRIQARYSKIPDRVSNLF